MVCALVNTTTGIVENLIVAVPTDPVPAGYKLVANPPAFVVIGFTVWDGEKFFDHTKPPEEGGLEML